MKVRIRDANSQDIPFLWDMLFQSLHVRKGEKPFPRDVLREPSIAKYLNDWGRTGDIGLIAESDSQQQLGAVWVRLFDEDHKGYGYVDDETPEIGIAVVEDYRGQGIGRALMSEIENRAKAFGYQRLSLSVDPENPALHLYLTCGYDHVGWCDTSWTMVKEL